MKNLNAVGANPRQKKLKNFDNGHILAISPPAGQCQCLKLVKSIKRDLLARFSRYERFQRLKRAVEERKLTESLEILEKAGITGDLAIYIVAMVHDLDRGVEV